MLKHTQQYHPDLEERTQALLKFKPFIEDKPQQYNQTTPSSPTSKNIKQKIQITPPLSKESDSLDLLLEKAKALAEQQQDLTALKEAVMHFKTDTQLQKLASHTVFFKGETTAKILLIGDMPSKEDDQSGQPFSSKDNHFYLKILRFLGYDIAKDIAFCNLIFWRPITYTISNEYYKIGIPFVHQLIHLLKPKKIILLGGLTAQLLLNVRGTLLSLRGKEHSFSLHNEDYPTLTTFHPYKLQTSISRKYFWLDHLQFLQEENKEIT